MRRAFFQCQRPRGAPVHIGVHKSSYSCGWASCPRRGLVQTSRFALVSHCRSHTGEKPFVCSVSECDKSFTRSDTLAKHRRQQHNISTPAPTRGGYRKRKRSMTPPAVHPPPPPPPPERHLSPSSPPHPDVYAPSHYNFANRAYAQYHDPRDSGFNTFRVNPTIHDRPAPSVSSTMKLRSEGSSDRPLHEEYVQSGPREEDPVSSSSGEEDGKPYNAEAMGGRSRAMVKYLIMKAKYRYVMDEKGSLSHELDDLKRQEKEEWREKEAGVDRVLRVFGPQSEQLIHEPDARTNGKRIHRHSSVSPREDPGHPPPHLSRHDHRMDVDAR
ncbi:hypothetical protein K439DRAFT_1634862 [Ramaria rubella]|nr:hypothetical protein K439DRAFT_1634862 [Ramaria rubella]